VCRERSLSRERDLSLLVQCWLLETRIGKKEKDGGEA